MITLIPDKILYTPRLAPEPLLETHADVLFDMLQDINIYKYIPGQPPGSVQELKAKYKQLESRKSASGDEEIRLNWAVKLQRPAQYLGYVQATVYADSSAQIGYVFGTDFQRKGYAVESCKAMVDFLLTDYGLEKLKAVVDVPNTASQKLLEKLGFKQIGRNPKRHHLRGSLSYMKTLIFLVGFILAFYFFSYSQNINWQWAKAAGGTGNDWGYGIASDANGNTYTTGGFSSPSITFGNITLTNPSSPASKIFIVKYNAAGVAQWAVAVGGANYDAGNSIALDDSDNIYVTGNFMDSTITFGNTVLSNNTGTYVMFLAKYDSAGNALWANSENTSVYENEGMSVATDSAGNAYVAGLFSSPTIAFGSFTLTNASYNTDMDAFVVKYSPAGNVLWAKSFGGLNDELPYGLAADRHGNVYVTGQFDSPSFVFGSNTLNNYGGGNPDVFILKYDSLGNPQWSLRAGGSDYDEGRSVVTDNMGNPVVTGSFFSSSITFGADTLVNTAGLNTFIVKYTPSGNLLWAKNSSGVSCGMDITTDTGGNICITGWYSGANVALGSIHLPIDTSAPNVYAAKYDAQGNVLWAIAAQGTADDEPYSVASDAAGNFYIAGFFKSPSETLGNTILTNAGGADIVITKIAYGPMPALAVAHTVTAPGCDNLNNGAIQLVVTGGSPPYDYYWSNGDTTPFISGLTAGKYMITIHDSTGDTLTDSITLNLKPLYAVHICLSADSICTGDSVRAWAVDSGGAVPFIYSWKADGTAYAQSDTAYFYQPDTLELTAMDSNQCAVMVDTVLYPCTTNAVSDVGSGSLKAQLFPVPANNGLYIYIGGLQVDDVSVYDMQEKLLARFTQPLGNYIAIFNLSAGMYTAQIKVRENIIRMKWIKI